MRATAEQERAVELFRTGKSLKITAFAGAGKTSTLRLLAEANRKRGVYLAFNKKIAAEAKDKFPANVDCRTTHSMAWRAIRDTYPASGKLGKSLFPKQLAEERGYVVWQSQNGMEAVPYKWLTADGGDELLYLTGALKFG